MNIFHRLKSLVADSGTSGQVSSNAWNDSLDIKLSTPGSSSISIVKTGCCALAVGEFELLLGDELELQSGAHMEIL